MNTKLSKEAYESPAAQILSVRTEGVLCGSNGQLPTALHESFSGDGSYEW